MGKIGILCASDTELEPFFKYIKCSEIYEKAMLKFYSGKIKNIDVIAVYSGVCKVNAAIAAQLLIDMFGVELIIKSGTAGGIDKDVKLFDTVISERAVYHDVADDILTDFHPWLKSNYFYADNDLLTVAKKYGEESPFRILFGTVATGEMFIRDEKREEIVRRFAPLSVDMETAAVAHVCYVNKIPFLSVGTITDTSEYKGEENFDKNCEAASERAAEIVFGILDLFSSSEGNRLE